VGVAVPDTGRGGETPGKKEKGAPRTFWVVYNGGELKNQNRVKGGGRGGHVPDSVGPGEGGAGGAERATLLVQSKKA